MDRSGQVGARWDFLARVLRMEGFQGSSLPSPIAAEAVSAQQYRVGEVGWVRGLTEVQPFPGELPLTGIIGQVFTLLLQRHFPRVHDDGQVAGLDVCMGWLGVRMGTAH